MRTRTLAGLAAGLLAAAAAGQPPPADPKQPPPPAGQPPGTTPTPSPLGPPPGTAPAPMTFPKEIGGKDLKGWLAELTSPDPGARDAALKTIPLFGPDAREPALKPLLAALRSERDPTVRLGVIDLLGTIGARNADEAREIGKALALALANSGPGGPSRLHLIRALTTYAADAPFAVTEVSAVITDPSWVTRRAAAFALGRLGYSPDPNKGPDVRALKALANTQLKDDSAAVRLEAVQSLILLGPPGYSKEKNDYAVVVKPFLDAATTRLKLEKDKGVVIWLHILVMRYDGSQLTDANIGKIAEHVNKPDPAARYHALTALAFLGEKAKPFVPVMATGLSYQEPELVYTAITSLAALGEHARQALPELERLKATTKDESLKAAIQEAIDIISGKKKPMAPAPPMPPPKMP